MMALETSRLNLQLQNFSRALTQNAVSLEQYTKNTGSMLSLASQIKPLHSFEKKHECQIEAPTSGESSPCLSDSEIDSRTLMPTLQEVSDLLTDELALEVDTPPEKIRGFHGKDLLLVFEDFDPSFLKNKFYRYLKETKYSNYISDRIVHAREMKSICFRGNNSLLVDFAVKKSDLIGGFMETFHACLKRETRRPIKMHRVLDDRRKKDLWFGIIIRNLPPKVTQKDIVSQCQRDVTGQLSVGTLIKVKSRHCCIVRCDYLEDAEIISKKLHGFTLKDPTTNIKYVVKAHLHPYCSLRHLIKDKSPFAEFVQSTDKTTSDKAGAKGGKTGISELLEIFNKSKKTSEKQKPPPPPPIVGPKRNDSIEEEKVAPPPPVNGMETFLTKIYSTQEDQNKPVPATIETEETSIFTKMIKQTTTEGATQEGEFRGSQEGSLNGKEGQDNLNKIEEETKEAARDLRAELNERRIGEANGPKLIIKKEHDEKRFDKRGDRSSSRHDRRSSSRRRRDKYEKNDYSSRRGKYDSRDYDRHKKNRSHKESKDRKRNRSRSRLSKSKSRSKSRSRSKDRIKNRRNNDYDSKRSRNDKSPKRSVSPNKKKYNTKARSRSGSKSRSRSNHRDKYKEEKAKKPVTLYEYEHKENRGESSHSPSKKRKRRDSRSRSHDRNKRRHDNKSPQKSSYYNHGRDKYHDYHKDSSYRKDSRDAKNHNDYKSSQRKSTYYSKGDHRDYDDKQRKRNRDKNSKSPEKRSVSRSSKGSRERRRLDSNERRVRSPSGSKRKAHQNEQDVSTSLKIVTANNEASKETPKEKN